MSTPTDEIIQQWGAFRIGCPERWREVTVSFGYEPEGQYSEYTPISAEVTVTVRLGRKVMYSTGQAPADFGEIVRELVAFADARATFNA